MHIKKRIKSYIWRKAASRFPWNVKPSYSQFGEDMVIDWLTRGQEIGFYVDVGAFHPIALSNTYSLYCRGWCGVNVEPRPDVAVEFQAFRPRDTTLSVAIGRDVNGGSLPMYVFVQGEYSTLDEVRAKELQTAGHRLASIIEVPIKTLTEVFEEYGPPNRRIDLLNIDVEGLDAQVLESNDWDRFRPRIIAVERHDLSYEEASKDEAVQFLKDFDYRLVTKCGPTLILDRES